MPEQSPDSARTEAAQRLRLKRLSLGMLSYACSVLIAIGCYATGYLAGDRVVHYIIMIALINLVFAAAIRSGINLRFKEPSLTAQQVIVSLLPSLYVMYFITDAQARTSLLLTGVVAMLFGVLMFDFRRMLALGGIVIGLYVLLIGALSTWAPERVNLPVEAVTIFAYAVVLALVAHLGSVIAGLRRSLKDRNRSLEAALADLEELATRDSLTRLPNRRSVMQQLEREKSRLDRRTGDVNQLSVAILDVDHFKRINDSHGHLTGDAALRAIADALTGALRTGDFAGRYGGEEFLLIFADTSLDHARMAAERIRERIGSLDLGDVVADTHVTVSLGVAEHRFGEPIELTLGRADEALYRAKAAGRDRVEVDEGPSELRDVSS